MAPTTPSSTVVSKWSQFLELRTKDTESWAKDCMEKPLDDLDKLNSSDPSNFMLEVTGTEVTQRSS